MKEEVKKKSEGEAKDLILKYCIENEGIHSNRKIKDNVFPDIELDLVNLLLEKISNSADRILDSKANGRYVSSNGITPYFLFEKGGYTQAEKNEKLLKEKTKKKENYEEQIRTLTIDNLRLGNWDIRFRWYLATGSFLLGIIVKYFIDC
jgi:hypothetical protein